MPFQAPANRRETLQVAGTYIRWHVILGQTTSRQCTSAMNVSQAQACQPLERLAALHKIIICHGEQRRGVLRMTMDAFFITDRHNAILDAPQALLRREMASLERILGWASADAVPQQSSVPGAHPC